MKKSIPISLTHPLLLKEWDFKKNLILTPDSVTFGSDKKAWWICSKNKSHSWLASISHRVHGRNCPFCAGKKINDSNSLATTHPELLLEWHASIIQRIGSYQNQKRRCFFFQHKLAL